MTDRTVDNQERLHPDALRVRQGRWTFELRGEEVADICYDGTALLRAVRPVVRDQDWNTLVARPTVLRVKSSEGSWSAQLSCSFVRGGLEYLGELAVAVRDDMLEVTFTGTALTAFRRNRIGLVVLHPASDAGREVVKIAPDGSSTRGRWPDRISPHQPFRDVQGFSWTRDDHAVRLVLDGDVFETEDQRNWTDSSFKTYSTPLDRPFPVDVGVGEQVRQTARLTVTPTDQPEAPTSEEPAEPVVVTDVEVGVVPEIATSLPRQPDGGLRRGGFSTVRLGALLVELSGPADSWPDQLDHAARTASETGSALDVRMVTADPEQIAQLLAHPAVQRAVRLAVFDPTSHVTTPTLWAALTEAARKRNVTATLVAGARSHFTELNRQRDLLPDDAAGVTFSLTPQMHAFEVAHLVDSLAGQRSVVRSALALTGDRPLHIGPVTLRQRFNAVATSADAAPEAPDPLQSTSFTAAWTLGSVAALTAHGVASLTYYQLAGPGGLGDAGELYPVGELLASLAVLSGRLVLHTDAPRGLTAYAVAGTSADSDKSEGGEGPSAGLATGVRVFVANLTDRARTIRLHDGRARPGDPDADDIRDRPELSAAVLLEPWSARQLRLGEFA